MNWQCLFKGHNWQKIADGSKDFVIHQKGDQPLIEFYSGILFICFQCQAEQYRGSINPIFKGRLDKFKNFYVMQGAVQMKLTKRESVNGIESFDRVKS